MYAVSMYIYISLLNGEDWGKLPPLLYKLICHPEQISNVPPHSDLTVPH